MKAKKALLVVDLQNDFLPGGALGIKGGDKIIPAVNKYIKIFVSRKFPVFASRDWHPKKTVHFKKCGGAWPPHCILGTKGAAFNSKLRLPKKVVLIYKGMDPGKDSYSAFQAKDANGAGLPALLRGLGTKELYIAGLATDYCVKFTARDALKQGFKVKILLDAVKGVNLRPDDSERAIKEMLKVGAKKVTLKQMEGKP